MNDESTGSDISDFLADKKRQPRLINITEGGRKEVIPLGKAILLIGRTDDAHVSLDSGEISRNHASIVKLGDHYCLRDNGSTNGSYINGEMVKFKELEHFDVIRFGSYTFLLDLGVDEEMSQTSERPQVKIPISHSDKNYTLTYNLGMPSSSSEDASASLTVMTKGYEGQVRTKKRTMAICPNCKLEVPEPSYGFCQACGEKLK
ncbi:MAG: FHA domain-containing protein [Verrucomicrobiae bacterium]|nr:FHA domain-containing protein [Verrucomicrobiae bacterium]